MHLSDSMLVLDAKFVSKLRSGDRSAQKLLYESYKGLFMAICQRYLSSLEDAEDILSISFVKIFTSIDKFDHKGSFEGWMKRIVVNEALMLIRANKNMALHLEVDSASLAESDDNILSQIHASQIMDLLAHLSSGYRTVFNLHAIEGYKHREIAEMLGISIHTSKTQYMMAKKRLAECIKKNTFRQYGAI